MDNNWKWDISRLKGYKIEKESIKNKKIKEFIDCALNSNTKGDILKCERDKSIKIESVGDFMCSGKSDILHLLVPDTDIAFGTEEYAHGKVITSSLTDLQNRTDDRNTLFIYVKRPVDEKVNCILKRRKIELEYITKPSIDQIKKDLTESQQEQIEFQRKYVLPDVKKARNHIILLNTNIEL